MDKSIESLIHLDVQRSFKSSKLIVPSSLVNVLKVYAYSNEEVQYCQGMNFLAGFLLLLTGSEPDAFKLMKRIIERYGMQNLFVQDVPLLKEYFYELARLIYVTYPDLSLVFRAEGVSTSFFASAWFMTIFSYSIQHVKDDKPTAMILKIWDSFILQGWKAVFKAGLFVVGELKEKLLEMKFDQIMALFGDVPRGKLLHDPECAAEFGRKYWQLKVTNGMLQKLSQEYQDIYKNVYDNINEDQSPQKSTNEMATSP